MLKSGEKLALRGWIYWITQFSTATLKAVGVSPEYASGGRSFHSLMVGGKKDSRWVLVLGSG